MANKFLPIHFNSFGKCITKRFKYTLLNFPEENKPNSETNSGLASVLKNENVKIQTLPATNVDYCAKNAIDVPTMFASFFHKKMQDIFKDPLFGSAPLKQLEGIGKQQFNTTAEFSDKGMTVSIDMKGFKQEDVNIRVEGPWLVIEGQSSTPVPETEGGGLRLKHIIRRFEVPPNSDVSKIKAAFKGENLTVNIPTLQPQLISGKPAVLSDRILFMPFTIHRYSSSSSSGETQVVDKWESPMSKSSAAITDKGMFITMNVKGYKKEDIYVKVEGTLLNVNVQCTQDEPEDKGGGKYSKQIYRCYRVPENSDLHNISVKLSGDQLTILIPTTKAKIKWIGKDEGQGEQSQQC